MGAPPLAPRFLAMVAPGAHAPADLEERLAALLARARDGCPEVTLDDATLVARLGELAAAEPDLEAALAALSSAHLGDVRLALACARHDGRALLVLEQRVLPEVAAALATIDPGPAFIDEVLQQLRERLLVGDAAASRLLQYSGAGSLVAWLRVAAVRAAISLRRAQWRDVPLEDGLASSLPEPGTPQLQLADGQAAERLKAALRHAITQQPSGARALLRFYYSDGLGVEELGRLYRVHASTISRRLAQAREAILAATRRRLSDELRVPAGQLDSVLGLAHGLEASIRSLLRSEA